ncbi:MAG: hypothetical protein JW849_01860 [Phycisphaerae bacterium]|nr:hypothetical protein [Phycisphaerae bacterium]
MSHMSQMNLLPEYYVKRRFRNRVDMLCVILFTLVMGGVITVGTVQGRKYRDVQAQYEAISKQLEQETGSMDEFIRLRGEKRRLLEEAKQVSDLEESMPRSYLVAMVTRALPADANLSVLEINEKITITAAMTQKGKGAKTKGAKGKGQTQITRSSDPQDAPPAPRWLVRIAGYAASDSDVAQIYTTLKGHSITDDVQLRHTREYEADTGMRREFQIDWLLKEKVDVLDHLTDEVGVVEAAPAGDDGQREDG